MTHSSSWLILALGREFGHGAISGSGGTANWPYLVLTTTNLPGNWMPVATNQFNPDGSFIFTNPMNPGVARQFFRLALP